jgi:cytochrome c oxidase subunit 1
MPSQSWFPLFTAISMLVGGLFLANHNYTGAISGGALTFLFAYLWSIEGPGGYHVHPEQDATGTTYKTPTKH